MSAEAQPDARASGELYDEYLRIFGEHEQEALIKLAADARAWAPRAKPPARSVTITTSMSL